MSACTNRKFVACPKIPSNLEFIVLEDLNAAKTVYPDLEFMHRDGFLKQLLNERQTLEDTNFKALLAVDKKTKQPLGWCCVATEWFDEHGTGGPLLFSVYVDELARGKGVARALAYKFMKQHYDDIKMPMRVESSLYWTHAWLPENSFYYGESDVYADQWVEARIIKEEQRGKLLTPTQIKKVSALAKQIGFDYR